MQSRRAVRNIAGQAAMKVCKQCGKTGEPLVDFRKGRALCIVCDNERSRLRMANYYQTDAYRKWLIETREARKERKERYRREAGCRTWEEMVSEKAKAKADRLRELEKLRAEREFFYLTFIGPPTPATAMTDSEYESWRYKNDSEYRAYHLAKRRRNVEQVTTSYARQQLGIKGAPDDLVEVKRLFILIKRQLKEMTQ